jgi:hypothetical protein
MDDLETTADSFRQFSHYTARCAAGESVLPEADNSGIIVT